MENLLQESQQILASEKIVKNDESFEEFIDWQAYDLHTQYDLIRKEIDKNWTSPTAPIFNLMKHKFRLEHELGKYEESALSMLQSQGLSFRHQALNQYSKRLLNDEDNELELMHRSLLEFQSLSKSNTKVKEIIKEFPSDWRIVQLSVNDIYSDSRFKKTSADKAVSKNLALKLVSIECGEDHDDYISVYDIPNVSNEDKMPSIQEELQDILRVHLLMYKTDKDKTKYKKIREEVDTRIESLIRSMENKWLGFFKVLFLGKSEQDELIHEIANEAHKKFFKNSNDFVISGKKKLLFKTLDGHEFLSEDQLFKSMNYLSQDKHFHDFLKGSLSKIPPNRKRKPTVLILDKEIQALPWESMAFLKCHPFSRVPSIHTLALLFKTHLVKDSSVPQNGKIRQDKVFYVLNPDQNLAKTQARLEPTFKTSLGSGVIGEQPSLPQMKKVLSEMDAYMYCGHGFSLKNLSQQEIEKLNIRALPLLFGCNSGKLERIGRLMDPVGIVNYYLIATAPCLLGFLWSVTDRDVDQWTAEFLQHWLNHEQGQPEFVQAVSDKKADFERMINKAAVVIYGLPSIKYLH